MSPLAAVEYLVGLQAQLPLNPYTALWSRLERFRPGELAALLLERRVVRIVVMRATLHLVTAGAAPRCLGPHRPGHLDHRRVMARPSPRHRPVDRRGGTALHRGLRACDGRRGVYLVTPDGAAGGGRAATAGVADVPRDRGREFFDLPDAPRPDPDTPASPRFLPEYDNLLLSHADRSRVVSGENRGRLSTVKEPVHGSVLHDGFVCGVWRLDRDREKAVLVISLVDRLTKRSTAAVTAEGGRLLRFLAADADAHDVSRRRRRLTSTVRTRS